MKRLFNYLRPFKWILLATIILLMISKIIEAYVPIYLGDLSQVILSERGFDFSYLINQCWILLVLVSSNYILDMVTLFLKTFVGQKAIYTLRVEVLEHIQKLPLSYFNQVPVGTLMTRTIHDVDQINEMFTESLVPLFGSLFLFLCIFVITALYDIRLTIVLAIVVPVILGMTNHFRIHQRKCYDKIRVAVASMNAFVQERLMGASTIRSFGLQAEEKVRFDALNKEQWAANLKTAHYFSLFFSEIDFMQSFSLILVFIILVIFAPIDLGFQAGTYFAFSLYLSMLFRPLLDIAERYNILQSALAAGDRIFKILDEPVEVQGLRSGRTLEMIESIEFINVWSAYKEGQWVLKGVSFKLLKGESIALVGVTGEGKTTILNLLLRFYDFQKGSIKINGYDIHEYSLETLRRQFSIVLQDPEIFSGTIEENITLFNPAITHTKIEFITKRFPEGLKTHLSERGKGLSLGERQLISLARAAAHPGSLLILDEATANIDTPTEQIIQEALKGILRSKTAIVIAHRLSTIKNVSQILVIHQGSIVERGTHEELLKAKGIYEKLFRLQFNLSK